MAQQIGQQWRSRQHMLEIIQHQERRWAVQPLFQHLGGGFGAIGKAQRVGDGKRHQLGIGDRRQAHEINVILKMPAQAIRNR